MAVPAEPSVHKLAVHGGVATHYVFYAARGDVAVMRSPRREGWTVIKSVFGQMRSARKLLLEYILIFPLLEDAFFLLREAGSLRNCLK